MNQTYQVNLMFNANTTQAKTALMDLQASMNHLTMSSTALPITSQLQQAQQAAAQLKVALNEAINMDTGKFDLSKFNSSLKSMGMDLNMLKTQLVSMGPAGQQAFMNLASSIMTAEIPVKRMNASLIKLGQTLKNTMRWQISSSMLMGFTTAIRDAYSYAQDLNESLNNIRIVTGQSIAQMDKFAARANKAAQALSASTLEYTNASLIYYQQGLTDAEVQKRADVTLKLANVTRQSAEIVSDQMTAIWNNFDDGTKSLEHYADVLTALGAATASSSDEIAQGLEKFSAIAETVGLSYEYAASALATVTAETRQSADVVGTAFKTIFSRMEGLKLGETLEDGTDLNKYSESLMAVGINIKDQQGNLREMDDILDDIGSKWQSLNKDQQIALAQSVAGVRQYNQFIALFNNWDKMQQNLNTANNSNGALEKQQKIYEESWEAANKRVKAAAEAIYSDLLNDKFFIELTDRFADLLKFIDRFIDGMGGASGVLTGLSAILLKTFAGPAAKGLENMVYNFKSFVGLAQQEAALTQNQAMELVQGMSIVNPQAMNQSSATTTAMTTQVTLNHELVALKEKMSDSEKVQAQMLLEQNKAYGDQLVTLGQLTDQAVRNKENSRNHILETSIGTPDETNKFMDSIDNEINISENLISQLEKLDQALLDGEIDIVDYVKQLNKLQAEAEKTNMTAVTDAIQGRGTPAKSKAYRKNVANTDYGRIGQQQRINIGASHAEEATGLGLTRQDAQDYANNARAVVVATREMGKGQEQLALNTEHVKKKFQEFGAQTASWSQNLIAIAQGISSMGFALSSLKGIWDSWNDDSLSIWEKWLQTFMSIGIIIPMISSAMKGLKLLIQADTYVTGINTVAKLLNWAASKKSAQASRDEVNAQEADTASNNRNTGSEIANAAAKKANSGGGGNVTKNIGKDGVTRYFQNGKRISNKAGEAAMSNAGGAAASGGAKAASSGWSKIGGSLKNLGSSVGKFAKSFGPAIIGITVAVIAFDSAVKLYNKDARAAEEAANKAVEATARYQAVAEDYESFQQNLSGYQDGVQSLQDLTKGTAEYREAVLKANDSVLELIKTNEDLKYTTDSNGLIILDQASLEKAKQAQLDALETAQAAKAMAHANASSAQVRADRTEFNRKYAKGSGFSSDDAAWWGGSVGVGAGLGAAIGSFIPVIGTLLGAGIGALAGAVVGAIGSSVSNDSTSEEDKALDILQQAYEKDGNAIFTKEGIRAELEGKVSEDLIKSLEENATQTKEMVVELAKNTQAVKAMIEVNAGASNQDDSFYRKLTDEEKVIMNKIIANRADEAFTDKNSNQYQFAKQAVEKDLKDKKIDLDNEYMKSRFGDNWRDGYKIETSGGKSTIYKKNEDGGWNNISDDKNTITTEEKKEAVIQSRALAATDSDKQLMTQILDLGKELRASGADKDAVYQLQQDIASGKSVLDLTLFTPEDIEKIVESTKGFSNEVKKAINEGIDNYSAEAYKARIEQEADNVLQAGAQELDMPVGALEAYTAVVMQNNEELAKNKKLAAEVAVETFRFSKSLDKLESTVKDNIKNIKNFNKQNMECYESLGLVQQSLEETFGLKVSSNFIVKNIDLISKAAEGNQEKVKELGMAISKDYIQNLELNADLVKVFSNDDFAGLEIGDKTYNSLEEFTNEFNVLKTNVLGYIDEISQANLGIGDSLSQAMGPEKTQEFVNNMNEMARRTAMSVEDMNALLANMNVTAKVESTWVSAPVKVPKYRTVEEVKSISPRVTETYTYQIGEENIEDGGYSVASISYDGSDPDTDISYGSANRQALSTPSSGGGGGGGGSSTVEKQDYEKPEVNNLKVLENVLKDIERAYKKVERAREIAWDPKSIRASYAAMRDNLKIQQQMNEQIADENEMLYNQRIQRAASEGFGFTFDASGNISNYMDIVKPLADAVEAAQNYADTFVGQEESDASKAAAEAVSDAESRLADAEEWYDKIIEARDGFFDAKDAARELGYQIADSFTEEANAVFDIKIELNEAAQKQLDYLLEKLGESWELGVERVKTSSNSLLQTLNGAEIYKGRINEINSIIAQQGGAINEAQKESLMDAYNGLLDILSEAWGKFNGVFETLSSAYGSANEDLEKLNDNFDTYDTLLGYYKDITALTNPKSQPQLFNILNTQLENYQNQMKSALEETVLWSKEVQIAEEEYAKAQALYEKDPSDVNRKLVENWKNILHQAQENYTNSINLTYEKQIAAFEKAISIFEEKMLNIAKNFEATLTAGMDNIDNLESMSELFDRQQTNREEYLSTNKQIYELNKMNRQLEQDISNTESLRAKQQLRDFQKEINAYQQEGVKMSEYELNHLQKQYELRLAEIALEEAQNNKNSMRLVRGADGNWSYMYTANQEEIDKAAQNVEDKRQELYELSDEYQNEMSGLIIQNMQDMVDALSNITRDKYETEAEYIAAWESTVAWYTERDAYLRGEITKAMDDLGISYKDTSLGAIENLDSMEEAHKNLETAATVMKDEAVAAFKELNNTIDIISTPVNEKLSDISTNVETIGTKSTETANNTKTAIGEMESSLEQHHNYISTWTSDYLGLLQQIINKYEELALKTGQSIGVDPLDIASMDNDTDYTAAIYKTIALYGPDSPYVEILKQKRNQKIASDPEKWGSAQTTEELFSTGYISDTGVNVRFNDIASMLMNEASHDRMGGTIWNALMEQRYLKLIASGLSPEEASENNAALQAEYLEKWPENADNGFQAVDTGNDNIQTNTPTVGEVGYSKTGSGGSGKTGGAVGGVVFSVDDQQYDDYTGPKAEINPVQGLTPGNEEVVKQQHAGEVVGKINNDTSDGTFIPVYSIKKMIGPYAYVDAGDWGTGKSDDRGWYHINGLTSYDNGYFGVDSSVTFNGHSNEVGSVVYCPTSDRQVTVYYYQDGKMHPFDKKLTIQGGVNNELIFDPDIPYQGDYVRFDGSTLNYGRDFYLPVGTLDTWLPRYDTGGYTGAWGPEGKLAMLHEKELVLNASDTQNMLASVELLRGISNLLIGNAGATTNMLATFLQAGTANGTHDVVQQTVSIEASFPGVQSAIEIEEALNNLVNDAVQYASVKKL